MTSIEPQCRLQLEEEELEPYPYDACFLCGWNVFKGPVEEFCVEKETAKACQ